MPDNTSRKVRTEGQIWIDKNFPNRLKYFVNSEEYTVNVDKSYESNNSSDASLHIGSVVALGTDGKIKSAKFPEDIEQVLGVIVSTFTKDTTNYYNVGTNGLVEVTISEVFSDTDIQSKGNINGRPVYWDITNSSNGKLTLSTPSGFDNGTIPEDNETNISYNNLPIIGTVHRYTNDKISIQLNFSKFDSSLEWSWPWYDDTNHSKCKISSTDSTKEIILSSPIFTTDSRSKCVITGKSSPEGVDEYTISTEIFKSSDNKIHITCSTCTEMYLHISGVTTYNSDKIISANSDTPNDNNTSADSDTPNSDSNTTTDNNTSADSDTSQESDTPNSDSDVSTNSDTTTN